jgi:hypothetical protein
MSSSPLQKILVRKRLVTLDQICHAVSYGHSTGTTWLEQLLLWRALDENTVVEAAGAAAAVPRCDLDRLAKLPYDVIGSVPPEVAAEHRIMPLWVEPDGDLRIAMVDPTDDTALEELMFFVDRPLLREIAPASAIAWALHRYHGAATPLWNNQRAALLAA